MELVNVLIISQLQLFVSIPFMQVATPIQVNYLVKGNTILGKVVNKQKSPMSYF